MPDFTGDYPVSLILFVVFSVVADINAIASIFTLLWALVKGLLGFSVSKPMKSARVFVVMTLIFTALTTPPIIEFVVRTGGQEVVIDILAGAFIIALYQDSFNMLNMLNPYSSFNPQYHMVFWYWLATVFTLVVLVFLTALGKKIIFADRNIHVTPNGIQRTPQERPDLQSSTDSFPSSREIQVESTSGEVQTEDVQEENAVSPTPTVVVKSNEVSVRDVRKVNKATAREYF